MNVGMIDERQEDLFDYCTLKNITEEMPLFPLGKVAGKYHRLPTLGKGDIEGGLRLQGKYKKDYAGKPLITYITVVFNRVNTLPVCMESIWKQDYDNIEYIIIDGGSTDGTLDIIKAHENHIDYFISQKDKGIYNAMNKGISLAAGSFICFINSDDMCKLGAAKAVVEVYKKEAALFVAGRRELKNEKNIIKELSLPRYKMQKAVIFPLPIHHQSSYAHRTLFERIGDYDESYEFIADYKWEIACIKDAYFIERELSVFSIDGLTGKADPVKRWREWSRLCNSLFPCISYKESEILHYSIRHFWKYCEVKTLLKSVGKKLENKDLSRTLYETCWYICFVEIVYLKKMVDSANKDFNYVLETLYQCFYDIEIKSLDDILKYIDNILIQSTENKGKIYERKEFDFVDRIKHQVNVCYHLLSMGKIQDKKTKGKYYFSYFINHLAACNGYLTVYMAKRQFKSKRKNI